jgi:myxalamid-type polyketide synthase MxaB
MAVGPGGFGAYLTISADQIAVIPECLSDEKAATIPSAFLTAHYALRCLGRMSAGDRVLIHAAAGGVGLAAVQIAQRSGADIFATAGTPEKRAYLKSLGVAHVMDSRSLDFAAEIMDITAGRGVDLVLNCLAGDFIDRSLSITAANGRFLEIGKTGIRDQAEVMQQHNNLSYFPIDLASEFEKHPALVRTLLDELLTDFTNGFLSPLPFKTFPVDEAAAAFRFMAQARHMGKIVITHPGGENGTGVSQGGRREVALGPDGTYLITGGLGGLGLLTARWMFERGAKHLVLMGRRPPSEEAVATIREMEEKGAQVVVFTADVSDRKHLAQLFSKFGHLLPRLRGIVHSAGILDDGVLAQQTRQRFEKVMAPKVDGAWHLHALSQDQPLDFFVLFSSAVGMLGSAGQGNHVAACAFEDALAHYRRDLGLPALSINWGPWAEIGAATQGTVGERLRMKGFRAIQLRQGLHILEHLLTRDHLQAGVMSVDWRQYAESLAPGHRSKLLSKVCKAEAGPVAEARNAPKPALLEQLKQAPAKTRRQLLETHIREQAIKVLGLSPSFKLDPKLGLATFGMDSLMTIELKNRLQVAVGKPLSSTIVFDHPTIAELAEYLDLSILFPEDSKYAAAQMTRYSSDSRTLAEVTELSDEEAEAILAKELSSPA